MGGGRTPDAFDGPAFQEAIIWDESTSDPAVDRRTQFVQDKGLMTFVDGVARPVGETREALWQHPVDEFDVDTPPGAPSTGYRIIVGDTPTGDFVGHEWEIAQWNGTAWVFAAPKRGTAFILRGGVSPYFQTALSVPWVWEQADPAALFGTDLQWVEDLTSSSTTARTWQQKLRLTTTDLPLGDYLILYAAVIGGSLSSTRIGVQFEQDDTTVLAEAGVAPGPSSSLVFSGHVVRATFSGVHTFDIDWQRSAGGGQSYISGVRLTLWRIS
jgi:hypothetical protein